MTPADHLLGVDGGNTKTVALVARPDGVVVGAGRGGCGDIYATPTPEHALAAVEGAVGAALAAAGLGRERLSHAVFSMAGADWPEDFALLSAAFRARGLGRTLVVVNDALGALAAGSPDGTGVVVACGTGIATGARTPDGRVWHSSFWQEANGAGHLGARALTAVVRAELGMAPPTDLTPRVVAHFGGADVEAILHRLTAREPNLPRADLARLAPLLLDAAAAGDPTAAGIVADAGRAMGDYAVAAARRVGLAGTPFALVLAGGVFRHPSALLAEAVVARVRADSPAARPTRSRFEPAVGALLLALQTATIPADDGLLARLAPTVPPAAFFAT